MPISQKRFIQFFLFCSMIPTGLFVHLDNFGWKAVYFFIIFALLEIPKLQLWSETQTGTKVSAPPTVANFIYGITALLPLLILVFANWNGESPFGGDSAYHLHVTKAYSGFVIRQNPVLVILGALAGLLVVAWFLLTKRLPRFSSLILFTLLYLLSYRVSFAEEMLGRYPGFFYALTIPANILSHFFHWQSPFNAILITNALSAVLWLFVLRPLFIGKWPDKSVFLMALFFFWQRQILWYFTSSYLEPWAIIFIFLGIESLFVLPDNQKWLGCVWIGFAAITKEPPVLLLPFFALALTVHQIQTKKWNLKVFWDTVGVSFFSLTGFLLFYFHRNFVGSRRSFTWRPISSLVTENLMLEMNRQLNFQYGYFSFVVLIVAVLATFYFLLTGSGYSILKKQLFLWACGAMLFSFFAIDAASLSFSYYSRFMLFPFALFATTLIPLSDTLYKRSKALFFYFVVVLLVFIMPRTIPFLSKALASNSALSNMEYYGIPTYFPVRKLLKQAALTPPLPEKLEARSFRVAMDSVDYSYPEVVQNYQFRFANAERNPTECFCTTDDQLKMTVFESVTNLALYDSPQNFPAVKEMVREEEATANRCLNELKTSCKNVVIEYTSEGKLWGTLGWGVVKK